MHGLFEGTCDAPTFSINPNGSSFVSTLSASTLNSILGSKHVILVIVVEIITEKTIN